MLSRAKEEEVVMAAQSGPADTSRSRVCLSSILGFFFNRGIRGGPKILLNLAALLVGLIVFVKLLPSSMTEGALQAIPIPHNVWSGLGHQQSTLPSGSRIVVFGELDIGTPVGASKEKEDSKTWTEALCDELACNTHISMVPAPNKASWSVSSNEIYARGVENVLNETTSHEGPGHDYSFVSTSFPPQWKALDLKAQIDAFLAMPKGPTPVSTLWVVSFGQWDVWSLSSLPVAVGLETVEALTKDIFEQVERLYEASKDPNSIAFSNIRTPKQALVPATNTTGTTEDAETDAAVLAEDTLPIATDTFQVLISPVLDPSLLPGWRELRPQAPAVHSKAEQMRNSATLTQGWNDHISDRLIDWIVQGEVTADGKGTIADDDNDNDDNHGATTAGTTSPIRDGFAYNMAAFVRDRIRDRQLRNAHIQDGDGLGEGAVDDGFRNVRNACLQPIATARPVNPAGAAADGDVKLTIPNVKLENDLQAPGSGESAVEKRAEYVDMPGLAYLSTAKECAIPSDYLFYTPFALSQKAILGIANETADLIRAGKSVRMRLTQEKKED